MNELMHVMQRQIDACNAIMIFGVHGLVIQVILINQIMGAKLSIYRKKIKIKIKIPSMLKLMS